MYKSLFLFYLIVSSVITNGQYIEGYVKNAKDNTPVSFVNVSIKGTYLGTVTNSNGYFSIKFPSSYSNKNLVFSFIGYKSSEYKLSDISSPLLVKLTASSVNIQEIVINPDSTMFTLLKSAYKKIPENYGTTPSLLTGFYRELLKEKDDKCLYIAESVIESYKTSYKNKQTGQIKILKTRKNIAPDMQKKSNVKFYGGLYVAHSFDVVHNRDDAIKPGNFKKYRYEYKGIKSYGDKYVYAFSYSRVDSNINGHFFIDTESLAYVYYDYNNYNERKTTNVNIKRDTTHYKIQYSEVNGKWFLKSTNYLSKLTNTTKKIKLVIMDDYVTTNVKYNNVKPPVYSEQISFGTIFSDIATTYDKSYWKDYNILEKDTLSQTKLQLQFSKSDANSMMTKKYEEHKSVMDVMVSILMKTYFDFGIIYNDYTFDVNTVRVVYNNSELVNNNFLNENSIGFSSLIGYKLSKQFGVEYKSYESLVTNIANSSNEFGFSYSLPVKRGGKQFFVIPGIAYYNRYSGYNIGFIDIPNSTIIDGKTFKNGGVNIYTGKKYQGISTGIIFKINIAKMLHFVLGANYYFPIKTTDMFLIEEKSGLFKKKTYQLFNNDIEYYEDGERKYNSSFQLNNWSFNAGIRFEF